MTVPKLRFPEFRDAGEWEIKLLKSICSMQAGKFISASNIFENGKGGIYPCYGGNGLRGYTKTYTHSGRYPLIGRQGALCGNVNLANGDFYATEHAVVVTPKEDINVNWLFYKLDLLNLNKYATGQAQPGLSVEVLEKIQCIVPTKESEQQKIADCLSSLDDRITLETQKLDTLKAHKKGLMQQLFPAEGETLPKLRFPEFQDAGEWKEKKLEELLEFKNGINASKEQYGKGTKFINVLDILQNEFITYEKIIGSVDVSDEMVDKFSVNYGDILFQRSSETQEEVGTASVYLDRERTATFGGFVIRGKKIGEYEPIFLNKLLKSQPIRNSISSKSGGSTRFNIGQENLSATKIFLPSLSEQKKIADCLSSIDEAIAAQSQAIELLKLHKKGLMQQLFPSVEEVKG